MTTVALSRRELAETVGISAKQARSVSDQLGISGAWTPDQIHRLEVAAALARVVGDTTKGDRIFPAAVRATFANEADPAPPCWAVFKDAAVSYVIFPADLFRLVGDGAVVAKIDKLWTVTP